MAIAFPELITHNPSYDEDITFVVDHINRCKQDNHVSNLRLIPQSLNRMNIEQHLINEPVYSDHDGFQELRSIVTSEGEFQRAFRNILPCCYFRVRRSDSVSSVHQNALEIRLRINSFNNDQHHIVTTLTPNRQGQYKFPKWLFFDNQIHIGIPN